MISDRELERLSDAEVDCLRCDQRMKDAGVMRFRENPPLGAGEVVGENRMSFQVYICPKCGKTEFFS